MKSIKIKYRLLVGVLSLFMALFVVVSCNDDDDPTGSFNQASLETLLIEAQGLIDNSVEGINAGDFQPGSIAALQDVVTWVTWAIDNAEEQGDIDDAAQKLSVHIDKFKASTVAVAMPWIQQENDTYIKISDNIKDVFNGAFTIEIKLYVVDVNTKGHSNNLFSIEQPGPDRGFAVRYYSDGKIQVVVGTGSGWPDTGEQAGAGTITSGKWIDVAMTHDGTNQILYIDGVNVAENEAVPVIPENPFVIGNSPEWTDRICNAVVRDFKVWTSVLDAATINANRTAEFTGTETGLECFFPMGSDLGSEFSDLTGKYTATVQGKVDWVAEPPIILLDYSLIDAAIVKITDFKATIVEGENDGDYPIGTLDYIDGLIAEGNDKRQNETRQAELDAFDTKVDDQIDMINSMLVGDTEGILIDRDVPSAIGFRITPNYTPQADYTVEFEVKVKSLFGYGSGEFFNNGNYGVWVYGYNELTEENVLNSGGLYHFVHDTRGGAWWKGPITDPLVMKTGVWQHVALVHDETALTTKIFVDGEMVKEFTDIGHPDNSGWSEMWLGNGWGKMDGYIKDFRLWDVARSDADLNANIDGTEAGLKVYFPLDKVKGVKFDDETGNFQGEMRGISWNKE